MNPDEVELLVDEVDVELVEDDVLLEAELDELVELDELELELELDPEEPEVDVDELELEDVDEAPFLAFGSRTTFSSQPCRLLPVRTSNKKGTCQRRR